jgi:hypothetical protein
MVKDKVMERIEEIETDLKINSLQISTISNSFKKLALDSAAGFSAVFDELKKVQKNLKLLDQKIQALAAVAVKKGGIDPDFITSELDKIRSASEDIGKVIQDLIDDSKTDPDEK